jgi:hypothetical protein
LFPKAKMTEAEQTERIKAWLTQDGNVYNKDRLQQGQAPPSTPLMPQPRKPIRTRTLAFG